MANRHSVIFALVSVSIGAIAGAAVSRVACAEDGERLTCQMWLLAGGAVVGILIGVAVWVGGGRMIRWLSDRDAQVLLASRIAALSIGDAKHAVLALVRSGQLRIELLHSESLAASIGACAEFSDFLESFGQNHACVVHPIGMRFAPAASGSINGLHRIGNLADGASMWLSLATGEIIVKSEREDALDSGENERWPSAWHIVLYYAS